MVKYIQRGSRFQFLIIFQFIILNIFAEVPSNKLIKFAERNNRLKIEKFAEMKSLCDASKYLKEIHALRNIKGDTLFLAEILAPGRGHDFKYICLINSKLEIRDISITSYPSGYGRKVKSTGWLNQIIGHTLNNLNYGRDIDAISGSTISGKSVLRTLEIILTEIYNYNQKNSLIWENL